MSFIDRFSSPMAELNRNDEEEFSLQFKRPGVLYLMIACLLTLAAFSTFYVADFLTKSFPLTGGPQTFRLFVIVTLGLVVIFLMRAPTNIVLRYYSYYASVTSIFVIQIAVYAAYSSRVASGSAELFWALTSSLVSATIGIYGLSRLSPNFVLLIASTGIAAALIYAFQSDSEIGAQHITRFLVHIAIANLIGYTILFSIHRRERAMFVLGKENQQRHIHTEQLTTYAEEIAEKKEQAEAAIVAKDRFLATMSHEIRTPMNAIITALNLLPREISSISTRGKELLSVTNTSSEALLGLLNDILSYARISYGDTKVDSIQFDARDLITKATNIFESNAALHRITLSCDVSKLSDSCSLLIGDAQKIRQIILNLVGNAVKFTTVGSVVVRASVVSEAPPEAYLRFSVRDTGCGIPKAFQASIFQPFTQADNTDQRSAGGSGLGLAITKQLVDVLRGSIKYDTSEGGTEFRVNLPVKLIDNGCTVNAESTFVDSTQLSPKNLPAHPEAPVAATNQALQAHVLLVDDNFLNAQVMRFALEENGFVVTTAHGGAEAISFIENNDHFDVIIMDIQMPGIDGYMATHEIRRIESKQQRRITPVVALTANVSEECKQKCIGAGMNVYLTKPVDLTTLCKTLNELINSTR